MPRVSLDTNILVYAFGDGGDARSSIANDVVGRASRLNGVLTQQVFGEFLNVVGKSRQLDQERIRRIAFSLSIALPLLSTSQEMLLEAFDLSRRHMLQFWDAVILAVCAANEVTALLTADMHDGQIIGGVTILNPFVSANRDRIDALFAA